MKKLFLSLITLVCCLSSALAADFDNTQIYLIGEVAPNTWSNEKAEPLIHVDGTEATFAWTGNLKTGEMKFINKLGTWDSFTASTANETVIMDHAHTIVWGGDDYKFIINEAGKYTITVDLVAMTMTVHKEVTDLPTELWVTGSGIPDGVQKLTYTGSTFKYSGKLLEGEIKIMTTSTVTSETQYLVPVTEHVDVVSSSGTALKYTADASAAGWDVSFTMDTYRVVVDLYANTLKGSLFTAWSGVYIVGGCAECGWSADNALPFTKSETNDNVYSWQGNLAVNNDIDEGNSFKLLGQQDWGPNNLHPLIAKENILTSTMCTSDENGDAKWTISSDGVYKIVVDLFNETFSATMVTSVESITLNELVITANNGSINVLTNNTIPNVAVYNITGKLVFAKNNVNSGTAVSNLESGVYLVVATDGNNVKTQKVTL